MLDEFSTLGIGLNELDSAGRAARYAIRVLMVRPARQRHVETLQHVSAGVVTNANHNAIWVQEVRHWATFSQKFWVWREAERGLRNTLADKLRTDNQAGSRRYST